MLSIALTLVVLAGAVAPPPGPEAAGSAMVAGEATWYCPDFCTKGHPPGSMVAAAGSELRFPGWRGSFVTVRHGGRSVRVQLVDWCGCPGSRIIDLYRAPFDVLSDPSRGVINVEVDLDAGPAVTLPPTETAP